MARQHGTKAETGPNRAQLNAVGRGLGFIILAGLGMAIFAALVLMPAWARAVEVEYARDKRSSCDQHVKNVIATSARLINAAPHDPIVTKRLAKGTPVQNLIHAPQPESPPKPGGWTLELANKLSQTKTRRGLFCVAIVSLAGAMFLFGPPGVRRPSRCRRET